jgi:hypothetical protein
MSLHMGLLRNRSQGTKTRRVESAGLGSNRGKSLGVRDRQEASPGWLKNLQRLSLLACAAIRRCASGPANLTVDN